MSPRAAARRSAARHDRAWARRLSKVSIQGVRGRRDGVVLPEAPKAIAVKAAPPRLASPQATWIAAPSGKANGPMARGDTSRRRIHPALAMQRIAGLGPRGDGIISGSPLRFGRRWARVGLAVGGVLLLLLGLVLAGLRINRSDSIPSGIYWLSRRPPRPGEYVAFCPSDEAVFRLARARGYVPAGDCPSGTQALFKVLVGRAGDRITIADDGVAVNGVRLPLSQPKDRDGAGRTLPDRRGYSARLGGGQVFLMSERCERGFDGRYFGPVQRAELQGALLPLWQW